jgi:hypothetical protein
MAALPKVSADYGAGFANGIIVRGLPLHVAHPGEIFWVDANAGRTGRGTFKAPDTTVDVAYNRTVSGRGDIIMVKPSHTENISAAAGLVMDNDSVAVVGLGRGSDQAQMISTAAAGDVDITGENNSLINMRFTCGVPDQVHVIDIDGDDALLQGCKFDITYAATNNDCQKTVTVGAGTTNFNMVGCHANYNLQDSSYPASFLFTEGTGFGDWIIADNKVIGAFTVAPFDLDDDAMSAIFWFTRNTIIQLDTDPGLCCLVNAGTVCINVKNNWGGTLSNTGPFGDDAVSFQFEDLGTEAAGTYATVFGTATNFGS